MFKISISSQGPICIQLNMSTFSSAVAVLLAVIIIIITGALVVGVFLNYKRTGSFIPSMPKLPRYLGSLWLHVLVNENWTKVSDQSSNRSVLFLSSASAAWWSPVTRATGWRFARVIMLTLDHHTLECHLLTQPCRWWVLQRRSLAVNLFFSIGTLDSQSLPYRTACISISRETIAFLLMNVKNNLINIIFPQDDHFAMEAGRQPITFENPLYATAPGVSGDPAVIHATQVLTHEWFVLFSCHRI